MTLNLAFLLFLPGNWEIWILLLIALLLFGHRIPGMARSLGSGIVEFKKGLKGGSDDKPAQDPPPTTPPADQARSGSDQGPAS